jgi:hypothetical protein
MIGRISYDENDIILNRNEIINVFNSMIDISASTTYHLFPLYKESFQKFCYDIIETTNILQYQPPTEELPNIPFIEEDKYIVITKKSKSKKIVDFFYENKNSNENEKI